MSQRVKLLPIVAAAATFAVPGIAQACRCGEFTPEGAYAQAQAVVVAEVLSVEGDFMAKGGGIAIVHTGKAWKASVPATIRIESRTTCAVEFKPGESYLVYLRPASGAADYSTNRCAGTVPTGKAAAVIEWLQNHAASAGTN
jgi:hypothetical protein